MNEKAQRRARKKRVQKKGVQKSGVCAYCGKCAKLTRDHIPPDSLFPGPKPSTLITVPCCEKCRESTLKDDEYFKVAMTLREDTVENPDVKLLIKSVLRGLARPEGRSLSHALLGSMHRVNLITRSGIYTGTRQAYSVEFERLYRVIDRISRGLYWRSVRCPVPGTHFVESFQFWPGVDVLPEDFRKEIWDYLRAHKPERVGNTVFSLWEHTPMEREDIRVFLMCFYERVFFIGYVWPKGWKPAPQLTET
ncbi:hypothetical protein HQ520_10820 [bacterium]|nr:hypothetical protein [bacterium]